MEEWKESREHLQEQKRFTRIMKRDEKKRRKEAREEKKLLKGLGKYREAEI